MELLHHTYQIHRAEAKKWHAARNPPQDDVCSVCARGGASMHRMHECRRINDEIKGYVLAVTAAVGSHHFLSVKEMLQILKAQTKFNPKGVATTSARVHLR